MLCQLVCTDRRYARMNCFNIRELQGILKRKFFTDLINSHDHKNLLEESMINLKYKCNSNINLNSEINNFYNFGILNISTFKKISLSNTSRINNDNLKLNKIDLFMLDTLNMRTFFLKNCFLEIYNNLYFFFSFVKYVSINPYLNLPLYSSFSKIFLSNFFFTFYFFNKNLQNLDIKNKNDINYISADFDKNKIHSNDYFSEYTNNQRFTRFNNLLINYDYKTGHYIGNWDSQYPSLLNSFIEVSRGIRKPN